MAQKSVTRDEMGSSRAVKPILENASLERVRRLYSQCQVSAGHLSKLAELIGDTDIDIDQKLFDCLESQKALITEVELMVSELEISSSSATVVEEDSRYLALYDELTGLPSRSLFRNRLDSAFVLSKELGWTVSVMFVDLDKFKAINDTYGHEMGDEVLRVVGHRLKSSVRETDLVARYGGDEFVCLLMDVRADVNLAKIASKILEQVSEPIMYRGIQFSVQASIGIARRPLDGEDAGEVIRSADQAMYDAKKNMTGYSFANQGQA